MSKIRDVCFSFLAGLHHSLSYYKRALREVIDHVVLGEHLAEILVSQSEVKERNVYKVGLSYHRIVKPEQRKHGIRQTFKCERNC